MSKQGLLTACLAERQVEAPAEGSAARGAREGEGSEKELTGGASHCWCFLHSPSTTASTSLEVILTALPASSVLTCFVGGSSAILQPFAS